MSDAIEVKVGQVWSDPRDGRKRLWRVDSIKDGIAHFDGTMTGSSTNVGQWVPLNRMKKRDMILVKDATPNP